MQTVRTARISGYQRELLHPTVIAARVEKVPLTWGSAERTRTVRFPPPPPLPACEHAGRHAVVGGAPTACRTQQDIAGLAEHERHRTVSWRKRCEPMPAISGPPVWTKPGPRRRQPLDGPDRCQVVQCRPSRPAGAPSNISRESLPWPPNQAGMHRGPCSILMVSPNLERRFARLQAVRFPSE